MGIEFRFERSQRPEDVIGQKDRLNKEIAEFTIDKFGEESKVLRELNILFYFDWMLFQASQSLGQTYFKGFPDNVDFLNRKAHLRIEIPNLSDFAFLVYLSRALRERDDPIFKLFTIAHEMQHVLQFQDSVETLCQVIIIKGYFMTGKRDKNEIYREVPTEVDAFRKSKIVAIESFGEKEFDLFIDEEIRKERGKIERAYWQNIHKLNIREGYEWKTETAALWKTFKTEIYSKYHELNNKQAFATLEKGETNFLEAIEFCRRYLRERGESKIKI